MVIIRADGNEIIGLGHFGRCSGIAEELIKRGEKVLFVVSPDSDPTYLCEKGFDVWKMSETSPQGWSCNELCKVLKENNCNILVIDVYRITDKDFNELREIVETIYIDDLASFDYNCDKLINYNVEANEDLYRNSAYQKELFLGPRYFPIRSEFLKEKPNTIKENVKKVLITTGSTDNYNITNSAINGLCKKFVNIEFNVLVGKYFSDNYKQMLKENSKKYSNVKLLSWGQNMAQLYKMVDLVIAPGSTTIFEALSMNVPCISFEFVDIQYNECFYLDKCGAVPYVGSFTRSFESSLSNLANILGEELDFEKRKSREMAYQKFIDMNGTKRIVDVILACK